MFCVINVGKNIGSLEGVYSTRNSKLIEIFLVQAFNLIYVIRSSSEHYHKKVTLF